MSWKKIPLAFRIAVVIDLVTTLGWIVSSVVNTDYHYVARIHLAHAGFGMIIKVMAAAGVLDLARTLTGRAAIGARIAMAGFIGEIGLSLAWSVLSAWSLSSDSTAVFTVMNHVYFAISFLTIVGLAIATGRLRVAITGIAVGLVADPPEVLAKPIFDALGLHGRSIGYVESGMGIVQALVLLWLVAVAAKHEHEVVDPARAVRGFRRSARALWLRIVAVTTVPALLLLLAGSHSRNAGEIVEYATIFAAAVNVGTLVAYAVGVLQVARARVPDVTRWVLVLASGCALWCAGLMIAQTPELVRAMFEPDGYMREFSREYAEAWSVVAPIVAVMSLALVVAAIAGFAGRRLHNDLHTEASGKGAGLVVLMLAAAAIPWLMPKAESIGTFVVMSLATLVCSVWGTVLMANLCTRTADALEREAIGLPSARVV